MLTWVTRGTIIGAVVSVVFTAAFGLLVNLLGQSVASVPSLGGQVAWITAIKAAAVSAIYGLVIGSILGALCGAVGGKVNGAVVGAIVGSITLLLGGGALGTAGAPGAPIDYTQLLKFASAGAITGALLGAVMGFIVGIIIDHPNIAYRSRAIKRPSDLPVV